MEGNRVSELSSLRTLAEVLEWVFASAEEAVLAHAVAASEAGCSAWTQVVALSKEDHEALERLAANRNRGPREVLVDLVHSAVHDAAPVDTALAALREQKHDAIRERDEAEARLGNANRIIAELRTKLANAGVS